MAYNGEYTVTVLEPHLDWGEDRNPTNRIPIPGESYVKIPSAEARRLDIRRGDRFLAYFENGMGPMEIKAAGNGPRDGNIQYAKQFEGIGQGACKAFTPWYKSNGVKPGDSVHVEIVNSNEIHFSVV